MDNRITKFSPESRANNEVREFELTDLRKSGNPGVFRTPMMRMPSADMELSQKDSKFHYDALVEQFVVKQEDPEIEIGRIVSARVEALKAEAEKAGREAGFTAGFVAGQAEGKAEVLAQSKSELTRLSDFLGRMEASKEEIFTANEEILNRIAVSIASSIVQRELKSDPEYLKTRIRNLVQEYGAKEVLKIRVSPERYDEILRIAPEFQAKFDTLKNLSVIADGFMDGNDFILETDFHRIDASLEHQIDTFKKALLDEATTQIVSKATDPVSENS